MALHKAILFVNDTKQYVVLIGRTGAAWSSYSPMGASDDQAQARQ